MDLSGVSQPKPLVDRAKAMILSSKDEWPVVAGETAGIGDILKGYVLPLAAIGPVAAFIGGQVFGTGMFGITYKPGFMSGLSTMAVSYVLGIAMVFALMFIADFLAPHFGGKANRLNAFKLAAYSYTASWLAGVFGLIPTLAIFGILGLWSFYILYNGVTPLMQVPQDKSIGYIAVMILCAFVLMLILTPVTALITGIWGASSSAMMGSTDGELSGKLTVPGVGSVDVDKIEQATKQMENAANGNSPAVASGKLATLLPASIGGYQRTATESVGAGQFGSTASGTYTAGDKSFTLSLADTSALGALAGLAAAAGVEQSREDADSYERTTTVDGAMQNESWNKTAGSGKFGRMVGSRFMVEASGRAASIDELKAAVAAIDPDDLTDLVE